MARETGFFKSATAKIILANVAVYLFFIILSIPIGLEKMVSLLALQPASIIQGEKLWTLFTSMFIHVQLWHLFVNMFSLYFIGGFVERLIGSKRFLYLYLASGVFASIFWSLLSGFLTVTPLLERVIGNPLIFGVGASGALFAMVGFLALITPRANVYLIAGPMIAPIFLLSLSSLEGSGGFTSSQAFISLLSTLQLFVYIYTFVALFALLSFDPRLTKIALPVRLEMWTLPFVAIIPLTLISAIPSVEMPIGNMAHLGGLIAGLSYAAYIKRRFPRKSRRIRSMFK